MSNDYPRKVRDVLASQNKKTISIVLTNTGPSSDASGGNPVFDIGVDDFTEETKTLAHAQAIGTIQEGKNTYQPSSQYQQSSITDNNGNPAPISDQYDDNTFIGQNAIGSGGRSMFVSLSDSDLLEINVIKGKAIPTDSSSRTYNELLAEINVTNGTQANSELTRNIVIAARRLNSNDPDEIYIDPDNSVLENESNVGKLTIQPIKGRRVLIPSYGELANNDNNDSYTGYTITPNQFKNFGYQIPLVAAGENVIPKDVNQAEEILKAQVGALVPGLARTGVSKVSVKNMQVAAILRQLTEGKFDKDTRVSPLDNDDQLSNGSYSSWLIPYAGDSQILILPMIGIQLFALGTIVATVSNIFALTMPLEFQRDNYATSALNGFLSYFGISYSSAVDGGTFVLLLTEQVAKINLQGLTGTVLDQTSGIGWSSSDVSFYSTVLRNMFKMISLDISNVVSSTSQVISTPNASTAIGALNSFASLTTNGYLRKLIDMFAYIGQSAGEPYRNNVITPGYVGYRSMGTSGITSKMIIPQSIIDGLRKSNTILTDAQRFDLAQKFISNPKTGYVLTDNNKLHIDQVHELERELEADYMPFYFHDLRTNEIVSFNAFLSSMSDRFSPDWQTTNPYGRVEPVHQYSGTTRDIEIEFFVVASNPNDFDIMWAKVNKLTTLVYPQYTKGREVRSSNESKFIQPFSQIPAGSPVFRLRLGDVWKSNYGRFNAMRLFGITDSRFTIFENSPEPSPEPVPPPPPPPAPTASAPPAAEGAGNSPVQVTAAEQQTAQASPSAQTPAQSANPQRDWRGGRTGPVKVVCIGDSQFAPRSVLNSRIENLIKETFPQQFANAVFEFKGVKNSKSTHWENPNSNYRGAMSRPREPAAGGEQNAPAAPANGQGTENRPARSQQLSAWAANLTNWLAFTNDADVVLVSLGGNDTEGPYSPESNSRIEALIDQIQGAPGHSKPIVSRILRPQGSYRGRRMVGGNQDSVIPRTSNNFQANGQGPHLTSEGADAYVLQANARENILANIQSAIRNSTPAVPPPEQRREPPPPPPPPRPAPDPVTARNNIKAFFNNDNNPIMKTFEDNGAGGGLAVICKSLNVDWNESTWRTDYTTATLNGRAPWWVKINMSMTVIHDIVPGIGADGFMTAPVYSVGNVVNQINQVEDGDLDKYESRIQNIQNISSYRAGIASREDGED